MRLSKQMHTTEVETVNTRNEELKRAINEMSAELEAKKKQLREESDQFDDILPLRRSLSQSQDEIGELKRQIEDEKERADLE